MSNDPEGTHLESTCAHAEHPEGELGAGVEGGATQWGALEALQTLEPLESAGHSTEKPDLDILGHWSFASGTRYLLVSWGIVGELVFARLELLEPLEDDVPKVPFISVPVHAPNFTQIL